MSSVFRLGPVVLADSLRPRADAQLLARLDQWAQGWRGPLFAALVVLVGALPGLVRMPALDRDESRFAQATAQMLETGDFVNIRFQDEPRDKKPVGIHWLQALSVGLVSSVEKRQIWAYRLPSIAGAMLAAAACAWGATAFLGGRGGLTAGVMLGSSFLLSTEAFIAKTDAVLCGAVTLSMAALGRLYFASRGGPPAGRGTKALFWVGQALAILVKGPIGPMVAGLALISLWAADREAGWIKRLGWVWGLVLIGAVVGPWAVAITVSTDGSFWGAAIGGDLAPKLTGGHESHGAPPGLHALLAPLLLFPGAAVLPAALVFGWTRRREPFARFALAWLVPSWLIFEAMPTKLVHYPLPLYGALAWLAAGALKSLEVGPPGAHPAPNWPRWTGAGLSVLAGGAFAVIALVAATRYGGPGVEPWAVAAALLALGSGVAGAAGAVSQRLTFGLAAATGLGVAAHAAIVGGLAPALPALWSSQRAAQALERAHLDPRNGVTPGPVAVAGYAEPSLVFALGTATDLGDPGSAADAIAEGQPALVEKRVEPAFRQALLGDGVRAQSAGQVKGLDYSDGHPVTLTLWRLLPAAPAGGAPAP